MRRVLVVVLALLAAPGCLVLSVNPAYDADSIGWEPALLGTWKDTDDNSSMVVERGEWKSYRIQYTHTIEKGVLTGYVTAIADDYYLDVMPARGEDHGSFLIPVHACLRLHLDGDRLELAPLSYDALADRLKSGVRVPGLDAAFDQKENVLLVTPTERLRTWLRELPRSSKLFGAPAVFTRVKK
jgi:hypothetical protein